MQQKQQKQTHIIRIDDDFDLGKIAASGQCFRVREWENGWFRFICGEDILYIRKNAPQEYETDCTAEKWEKIWSRYFALDVNYADIRKAISPEDAFLQNAAESGAGIRILRQPPFETLITFILSQRKSIPAIKGAVEALCRSFGTAVETPYETVYLFPTVQQLACASAENLEECRLGYRLPYVTDAVQKISTGKINPAALELLSDDELCGMLKTIRGVGDKVAHCTALFAYGRTGLAPVDTWIRQVIDCCYGGINPFPAYGQYAGIMQQYIFYYAVHHKKEVHHGENPEKS